MNKLLLPILMVSLLAACGNESPGETSPPAKSPETKSPPPASEPRPSTTSIRVGVRVVDLTGTPLAQMAPIVTRKPNAFDQPVATGSATDSQGNGSISFPTDEDLFLRAWDPALNFFPNNFYEILAGGNQIEDDLVIQMVPAATLAVQLVLPDNALAAELAVGLMLYHPTRGPWWPTEGTTNRDGFVSFPNLPAGEYVLRFKTDSGARLEHRQTALPPGGEVDLGVLTLQ
jgi:hypothetical protein